MEREVSLFISLVLTFPTIFISFWVVQTYWNKSFCTVAELFKGHRIESRHLLMLGITIGFMAFILNNSYWWVVVVCDFLGFQGVYDTLIYYGSYANIITRQLSGILAGGLHLYAAHRMGIKGPMMWLAFTTFLLAIILGLEYHITGDSRVPQSVQ